MPWVVVASQDAHVYAIAGSLLALLVQNLLALLVLVSEDAYVYAIADSQFTCFTSTKVQILTQKAHRSP